MTLLRLFVLLPILLLAVPVMVEEAHVLKVIDGDFMRIELRGLELNLRLLGIGAPDYDTFLEIKPVEELAEREIEKALLWVKLNDDLVILEVLQISKGHSLVGTNSRPVFMRDSIRWGECPRCRTIVLADYEEPNCNCFDPGLRTCFQGQVQGVISPRLPG